MINLGATIRAILIAAAVTFFTGHFTYGTPWHYQDEEHWPQKCKEGKHQSPIALNAADATLIDYKPFSLVGYGELVTAVLKNNGHSAEIRPKISGEKPVISGGGLNHTYKLDHLHFHWQSEHLSPDDDEEFEPLVNIIDKLKDKVDQPVNLTNFAVKHFIPRNVAGYYRYEGSLTTPECNEGVMWTVKVFDEMRTEDHKILKQNYRSLQSLNERKLYLKRSPVRENYINSATTYKINTSHLYSMVLFSIVYSFKSLFTLYEKAYDVKIMNNGHTVVLILSGEAPRIRYGGLDQDYILEEIHFHWHSEHTAHLVHYKEDYNDMIGALKHDDGIAVLGVLFDLSSDENDDFEKLVPVVPTLQSKVNQPTIISNFIVRKFLPSNLGDFYRYHGSLTTPYCNEVVVWSVFTDVIEISQRQVSVTCII
nr:unnamed protein product [Callosobruchus analis]